MTCRRNSTVPRISSIGRAMARAARAASAMESVIGRLANQEPARLCGEERFRGHRTDGDPRGRKFPARLIKRHGRRRSDDGDIHFVPGNEPAIVRTAQPGTGGKSQLDQDLARRQHVRAGPRAEVFRADLARPIWAGDHAHDVEGDQRRDRIGRRAGVAQVAADAGPALDLDAADDAATLGERRVLAGDPFVFVNAITGDRGAQAQPAVRRIRAVSAREFS